MHFGVPAALFLTFQDAGLPPVTQSDAIWLWIALGVGALALIAAFILAKIVLSADTGTPDMQAISNAIREGAEAFLARQYKTIGILAVVLAVVVFFGYHASARTAVELAHAQPEVCDEVNIVVLEQRAGRPRGEAWKHMAERTDVDCVRNLVTMLVQAEQFGTSIAKTLRIHSDTLRTQRVQAVEEAAAKTTIKLLFPLALFIFPSLFVVVLGPAILSIMHAFSGLNQ